MVKPNKFAGLANMSAKPGKAPAPSEANTTPITVKSVTPKAKITTPVGQGTTKSSSNPKPELVKITNEPSTKKVGRPSTLSSEDSINKSIKMQKDIAKKLGLETTLNDKFKNEYEIVNEALNDWFANKSMVRDLNI